MKIPFKNAHWIWSNSNPKSDEYSEFYDKFDHSEGPIVLSISSDSNYAVYINGELAAWGQYADFPYDKIYDEIDVTKYCRKGRNHLAVIVWYYGIDSTQVYYPGKAGLIYELISNSVIVCKSDKDTLSRLSKAYISHREKLITSQLGLSFFYNAALEDNWMSGELKGFSKAVVVEQKLPLRKRPCKKLILHPRISGKEIIKYNDTNIIFDLKKEVVGFLEFRLISESEQYIEISYGEHLDEGHVPQKIEDRDFSVTYYAKKGENLYLNPFRRLGCRYLEIYSKLPVTIKQIGIAPTVYEVNEKERPKLNIIQNNIYDMCVETLKLCMHEHYEDCPWREQALYTMDSRNQMLCGYYAFGEYEFPRSNLELISKDNRDDGLLSICYPIKKDFVIPSFSLYYIIECREYLEYSNDKEFIKTIYPKLQNIIDTFINRIDNGLVSQFEGDKYWNFYEWRCGLDGVCRYSKPDLILNSLLSYSLQNMDIISEILEMEQKYTEIIERLNSNIMKTFWDDNKKLFYDFADDQSFSQLGNSLAILCNAVQKNNASDLSEAIIKNVNITKITLSMKFFLYDALLKVDRDKYSSYIIEDIEKVYMPMIESGGNTVWETEYGANDFNGAGSLCHGWSALPIYYFHLLKMP